MEKAAAGPKPDPALPLLYAKLEGYAPEIRVSYEGAMHALCAKDYPDRLVHFSHSMREVIDLLARAGYGDMARVIQGERRRLEGLCKAIDPAGQIARESMAYAGLVGAAKIYDELSGYAHHKCTPTQDRAEEIARIMEDMLLLVTRPQTDIIRGIDSIVGAGPSEDAALKLKDLTFRRSSGQYLLDNMPCEWLECLDAARLFEPLSAGTAAGNAADPWLHWSLAGYLSRCSSTAPDKVAKIIVKCGEVHGGTNPVVCRDYIRCALEASGKSLKALARKAMRCKWHVLSAHPVVSGDFVGLVGRLYDEGLDAEATELMSGFLDANMGRLSTENEALSRIMRDRLPPIAVRHCRHLWRPLADIVRRLYEAAELQGGGAQPAPHAAVDAIEDSEGPRSKHFPLPLCVMALRDCLVEIGKGDPGELARCIDEALRPPAIFARLALFLYGEFPEHFHDRALDALIAGFADSSMHHEYCLLLGRTFAGTDDVWRDKFFEKVDDRERQKRLELASCPRGAIERIMMSWLALRMHPIRDQLEGERKERYEDAVRCVGPPAHPDFPYQLSVLPMGSVTHNMFANSEAAGVFGHVASYTPRDGVDPDLDSTLRSFYEFVRIHPLECSRMASRVAGMHAAAQYSFLSGMETAVGKGEEIDWDPLLNLVSAVLDPETSSTQAPPMFDPALEAARVVKEGLELHRIGHEAKGSVWEIVEKIVKVGDLRPKSVDCDDDADSLSDSFDTMDGISFHVLCSYIRWMLRHGAPSEEATLEGALKVIDAYAGDRNAHTATRHAALGLFMPMLSALDREWATTMTRKLFSGKGAKKAFWQGYAANTAHEGMMGILLPLYKEFLVGGMSKRIKNTSVHTRTVIHVELGYIYGVEGYKKLFWKFVGQGSAESIRQCGYDLANVMKDNPDRPEVVSRVLAAWRSQEFIDNANFCAWFSMCGAIGDASTRYDSLRTFQACLERHSGYLDPIEYPLGGLRDQADEHPTEVAECVLALTKKIDPQGGLMPDELHRTLKILLQAGSAKAKATSIKSIEHLVGLGCNNFTDLLG